MSRSWSKWKGLGVVILSWSIQTGVHFCRLQAQSFSYDLGMYYLVWSGTLYMVNVNINAENYISILDDRLWSFLSYHFPDNSYTFQDDNTPIHWAHLNINTNIHGMVWPAQSLDKIITENCWHQVKRTLQIGPM